MFALAAFAFGCQASDAPIDRGPDAFEMPDTGGAVTLPTWALEDVQPESPRAGQTYGLDAFAGKTVVVALLEGF
jgi:hypothetical protein